MGPSGAVVTAARYRWVVLGVGTAAQATVSAAMFSVAVLAPQLRAHFHLTIGQVGIALAAFGIGMTPTLLPWGLLADRVGERVVLPLGLGASAFALAGIGLARRATRSCSSCSSPRAPSARASTPRAAGR